MDDGTPFMPDLSEPIDPHERAALRRKEIDECDLCDDEGYRNGTVCHHNPHQAEINRRGMALVREALKGKPNDPRVLHRTPLRLGGDATDLVSGSRTVEDDPEPEL